jgi:hypothetical protein
VQNLFEIPPTEGAEVSKMGVPLKATSYHTTERLLELALITLDNARREQNNEQLPANNWRSDCGQVITADFYTLVEKELFTYVYKET